MATGDSKDGQAGDRPLLGVLANSASFAAASLGDVTAKLVLAVAPTAQAIALRSLMVIVIFAPIFAVAARRGQPVFTTAHPWLHLSRFGLHLVSTVTGFVALRQLPLTTFTTILFAAPMFIALGAAVVIGERIRPHHIGAIVMGFIGCLIILRPRNDGDATFLLLAFASAATWGLSVVVVRMMAATESRVTIIAWSNGLLTLFAGAVALVDWRPVDLPLLALVLAMAVSQIAGQFLSITAMRMAPAATVAPAQYTQILWATAAGMVLFGEWPQPSVWLGAAFIVAGGIWLMRSERWP